MADYLIQRLKQDYYVVVRSESDIVIYEESFTSFRDLVDYFRKIYDKTDNVQTMDLFPNEQAGLENIVLKQEKR